MSGPDDDVLRAEREYLRQRATELLKTTRAQAEAYEELAGPLEGSTDFVLSENDVTRVLGTMLVALRRSGNPALAARYQAAWDRWLAAVEAVERCNRAGEPADEATLDALNEAQEEFDRVVAAATSWLDERSGGEP